MRAILWTLGAAGLALSHPSVAQANGGPVKYSYGTGVLGSVMPVKSARIKLQRERVQIDVYPLYSRGKVTYKLRNLGPATTLKFGFPTLVMGHKDHFTKKIAWKRGFLRYRIKVDGKAVRARKYYGRFRGTNLRTFRRFASVYPLGRLIRIFQRPLTGKLKRYWRYAQSELMSPGNSNDIGAYEYRISEVRFPARKVRTLEIEFTVENYVYGSLKPGSFSTRKLPGKARQKVLHGLSFFSYATWPARYWAGKIDRADFRIRLLGFPWHKPSGPRPPAVVSPKPTQTRGATYHWKYRNYVPKQNLMVLATHSFERTTRRGSFWRPSKMAGLSSALLGQLGSAIVQPGDIAAVHQSRYRAGRRRWIPTPAGVVDGDGVSTRWLGRWQRRHKDRKPGLRITFKKAQRLRAIGVVVTRYKWGHGREPEGTRPWSRPKQVTLRAGTLRQTFTLADRKVSPFVLHRNMQTLRLKRPVTTRQVEVIVQDVHRGSDYFGRKPRVVINELVFFRDRRKAAKRSTPRRPARP